MNARAAGNLSLASAAESYLADRAKADVVASRGGELPEHATSRFARIALLATVIVAGGILVPSPTRDGGGLAPRETLSRSTKAYVALPSASSPPSPVIAAPRPSTVTPRRDFPSPRLAKAEPTAPSAPPVILRAPPVPAVDADADARAADAAPIVVATSGDLLPRDCGSGAYAGRLRCRSAQSSIAGEALTRSAADLNTNLNGNLLAPGAAPRR